MEGEEEKKSGYLEMSEDINGFKKSSGVDKVLIGSKILGKGLFNALKYTNEEILPEMVKRAENKRNK